MSKDYDVLLCGSEKVGIPLAMLGSPKPIVMVAHNMSPKRKAQMVQLLGVTKRWAKVGVFTQADANFMAERFGYKHEDMFNYISAPVDRFTSAPMVSDGVIVSAGVASRDYPTLVAALKDLPGYQTEIYAASRYHDAYRGGDATEVPAWVTFMSETPHVQLAKHISENARFVVIPLVNPTQFGSGGSALLEAYCMGKPVIATKTIGIVDYVQEGVTGFLVPQGDSAALREAIRKLWEDPQLAHRMGQAGRKFVEENYSPHLVNAGIRKALADAFYHR